MTDGDHGLKVHAGKESQSKTLGAMRQVISAICAFAHSVNNTAASNATQDSGAACSNPTQHQAVSDNPKAASKRKAAAKTPTAGKKAKLDVDKQLWK